MRQAVLALMTVLGLVCSGRAEAGMITYTEQANLAGSLGGNAFSTLVTFTITADTSNVVSMGVGNYSVIPSSGTITLASGGGATFTDPLDVFLFQGNTSDPGGYFELGDSALGGLEILTDYAGTPGFSNVFLTSSFAPISGASAFANTSPSFMTSAGALQITGSTGLTTVSGSTVPEPSSLVLTGIAGLISLAVIRGVDKRTPVRS